MTGGNADEHWDRLALRCPNMAAAAAAAKARELHLSGMSLNGGVGHGGY